METWAEMSDAERAEVVDALPSSWPDPKEMMSEGDYHSEVVSDVKDVLSGWYGRSGRSVYLAQGVMVYYPDQDTFAPDILAVLDASMHQRDSWVVAVEGRGLDLCIEVHWKGRKAKDLRRNVQRYAELGIPEYFVFDRRRMIVRGWRLPGPALRVYEPIVPQGGCWTSLVLGLDIGLEGNRFRFYASGAVLPATSELLERASRVVGELQDRLEAEAQRAEAEARRADAAQARIEELERLLAEARKRE